MSRIPRLFVAALAAISLAVTFAASLDGAADPWWSAPMSWVVGFGYALWLSDLDPGKQGGPR